MRTACQHCNLREATQRRLLCRRCYYTPEIRTRYKRYAAKRTRRLGVGIGTGGYALPEPTEALPGSAEKFAELERRAALGLALFHPRDAKYREERR